MSDNLNLPDVAESQNNKYLTVNEQADRLDGAITDLHAIDLSGGAVTVTDEEYRIHAYFRVSGANDTVTIPAIRRLVAFEASGTGFTLACGATSLSFNDGDRRIVYTDGTTDGLIDLSGNLSSAPLTLQGEWDASTGSFPGGGSAQRGFTYIVSAGGTVDGVDFSANDRIVALVDDAPTGTYTDNWLKLDYTDQVLSVAGKTGAVTLAVADLTDGGTVLVDSNLAANGGTIPETDRANTFTNPITVEGDQATARLELSNTPSGNIWAFRALDVDGSWVVSGNGSGALEFKLLFGGGFSLRDQNNNDGLSMDPDGSLKAGSPTGGSQGYGTINAINLYIEGQPVFSTLADLDIPNQTEVTPASDDDVLIGDTSDGGAPKKAKVGSLGGAQAVLHFGGNINANSAYIPANGHAGGDGTTSSGSPDSSHPTVAGIIDKIVYYHENDQSSGHNSEIAVDVNDVQQGTFILTGAGDSCDVATGLGITVNDGDIVKIAIVNTANTEGNNPGQSQVMVIVG